MTKEKQAFYRGMLAALAVIKNYDQRVLFDEIVGSADAGELVAVAQADGQMEMSGLMRYGYGGCAHEWGIDGAHSNEYCKKCYTSRVDDSTAAVPEIGAESGSGGL